jgi:hypothetical protein
MISFASTSKVNILTQTVSIACGSWRKVPIISLNELFSATIGVPNIEPDVSSKKYTGSLLNFIYFLNISFKSIVPIFLAIPVLEVGIPVFLAKLCFALVIPNNLLQEKEKTEFAHL